VVVVKTSTTAETFAIRDSLLALAGRHPIPAAVLFERLRDEWGTLCERRLWRAINWLVAHGKLQRVGDRYHSEGYVRVPDAAMAPGEADRRERLELNEERRCYDCKGRSLGKQDQAWFRALNSGYCFGCYQVRANARRSAA